MKNNRLATFGLTAGLLAGGTAGLVFQGGNLVSAAQTTPTTEVATTETSATTGTSTTGASTTGSDSTGKADRRAERQAQREAERKARLDAVLKPLVDDGTLTQEQADKVVAALIAADPMRRGDQLTVAAEAIGITADALRTELVAGKTVAEVATANGKTAQDVIDALVAEVKSELDIKVTAGTLTQESADARLVLATEQITTAVNETAQLRGPGFGERGRRVVRAMTSAIPGFPGMPESPTTDG